MSQITPAQAERWLPSLRNAGLSNEKIAELLERDIDFVEGVALFAPPEAQPQEERRAA